MDQSGKALEVGGERGGGGGEGETAADLNAVNLVQAARCADGDGVG